MARNCDISIKKASLGFYPLWCCKGKRREWKPSVTPIGHCQSHMTIYTMSALHLEYPIMFHGVRETWRSLTLKYEQCPDLQQIVKVDRYTLDRVDRALLSADLRLLLMMIVSPNTMQHTGVLMNVTNHSMIGHYRVNNRTQVDIKEVSEFMMGPSGRHLAVITKKGSVNQTLFSTVRHNVCTFQRDLRDSVYRLLHVHAGLTPIGRMHGPAFTPVPGQGTDAFCVAFFTDFPRLKLVTADYSVALVDMETNRYLQVAELRGPDGRRVEAFRQDANVHGIRATPSGSHLVLSLEPIFSYSIELLVCDTRTLSLQQTLRVPLALGVGQLRPPPHMPTAACSCAGLPTFSRCSSRVAVLTSRRYSETESVQVEVYQVPGVDSLQVLARASVLRACPTHRVSELCLPRTLQDFIEFVQPRPTNDMYIETAPEDSV